MLSLLRPALVLTLLFTGLTGLAYPLAITGLAAQVAFAIGQGAAAEVLDPEAKADGGQHIGQAAARGIVHDRQGRGDGGNVKAGGQPVQPGDAEAVLAIVARGDQQMRPCPKAARQPLCLCPPQARAAGRPDGLW